VKKEKLVFLDSLGQPVEMDCLDQEGCLVCLAHKEILVKMASKVKLVHLALKDSKEQRVKLAPLEALAQEAREENWAPLDPQEIKDHLD